MDIQQILNLGVGAFGMYLMYKLYSRTLDQHAETSKVLAKLDRTVTENTIFMKNLNGKLEKAVKDKATKG